MHEQKILTGISHLMHYDKSLTYIVTMKYTRAMLVVWLCLIPVVYALADECVTSGSMPFNRDWKFILEDVDGAEKEKFDDSTWRILDLPHDWAIENGFHIDGAQADKGGYACGGIGWYRKSFNLNVNERLDRKIYLDFDAVYMNSEVWVNGNRLGKRPYGYISFSYDITPYVRDGRNVVSVRVDNSMEPSARWYHGCGIYGDVNVRYENLTHFVKDGIFVSTPSVGREKATVNVRYALNGDQNARVTAYILCCGKAVSDTIVSYAFEKNLDFTLEKPELWSPDSPTIYQMVINAYDRTGNSADVEIVNFGVRSVRWDPEKGFFLNGIQTKLRGVCEHLEGGPVGAAWTRDLMEWKLKLLKEMGCNAIRTAHNPQLPMFYDICDRLGIMVMDEAFDGWGRKAEHDYGAQAFNEWWEKDLRDFVRRDRNHPCVVIWSVGNETKGDVASELVRVCHEEDPTRAVTSGHSGSEHMDVLGINGHSEKQRFFNSYTPARQAFVGTETPHTWQVRGFYRTKTWYRDGYPHPGQDPFYIEDLTKEEIFGYDWTSPHERRNIKQVFNSSYDNATVRLTARHNIAFLRDMDWYSGHFRWTGFDYLGEAGYVHGGWPFRAFQGGVVDLAGFPKDLYYLYQSQWREDMDMVHILPHWTHPDMEAGTLIPVWVYTSGTEAELLLNGKSLGIVSKGREWNKMQCEWMVPWERGTLTAIAYRNGKEICRQSVSTSDGPQDFTVTVDGNISNGTSMITVTQTDANGNVYPYGDNRVFVSISNAVIHSFENGNPVDTECNYRSTSRRSFYGKSRAFLKETDPAENILALAGMINVDRSLKVSSMATITVHDVVVRGKNPCDKYVIRYSTDGSEPGMDSKIYSCPFNVIDGMRIRAKVYKEDKAVLEMEETISSGVYWGKPGEYPCCHDGMQAEYMILDNAAIKNTDGEDVYGEGYVFFKTKGSSIEWYQENDSGERKAWIEIRYSQLSDTGLTKMELSNNSEVLSIVEFLDTGSENRDWKIKKIEIDLPSGANNLKLKSLTQSSPSIDSISLK